VRRKRSITISDVQRIVDHLFITRSELMVGCE
jgi:hypothetical protein